jgi:hypothetical protein
MMAFGSVEDLAAYLEGIASKQFVGEGLPEPYDAFAEFVKQYDQSTNPVHNPAINALANSATATFTYMTPNPFTMQATNMVNQSNPQLLLPCPTIQPQHQLQSLSLTPLPPQFRTCVDLQCEIQTQETPFAQPIAQNIPDNFINFNAHFPSISSKLPAKHSFHVQSEKKPSKSRKVDYTKLFLAGFQALLQNKDAKVPLSSFSTSFATYSLFSYLSTGEMEDFS